MQQPFALALVSIPFSQKRLGEQKQEIFRAGYHLFHPSDKQPRQLEKLYAGILIYRSLFHCDTPASNELAEKIVVIAIKYQASQ
jgi:hypothetical protein